MCHGIIQNAQGSSSNDHGKWHSRMGHPSDWQTRMIITQGLAPKKAANPRRPKTRCDTCLATQTRAHPVPRNPEPSGEQVVQVDYVPIERKARIGWKDELCVYVYAVRASKLTMVYPVRGASAREAVQTLEDFLILATNNWKVRLTCVQYDQGTQFLAREWNWMCNKHGVGHRQFPTNAQAMNGQAERVQGILINNMRAIMRDTATPTAFWPLAIQTVAWIYNRTPHRTLRGKTPWEVATGEKPDLRITRVFGCKAYVQIPKGERQGKTDNPTWQGILVGYSETSPEWIILDPISRWLRIAYHVEFDETSPGWPLLGLTIGNSDPENIYSVGPMPWRQDVSAPL